VLFPLRQPRRHFQRMQQITEVLLRHGMGYVAAQLGLPLPRRIQPAAPPPETAAARVRAVLEDLGPTFIKLGQILSTRADILPAEWVEELSRLQDQVAPFPMDQVRAQIEAELGAPLETLFRWFDPEPIAAASVGQVHRAELMDGMQVVVKVQRPGLVDEVEGDLAVLTEIARLAEGRTAWGKVYSFTELVDHLAREMRAQLDYTVEGRHAEHVREVLADDPDVIVPAVYWTYTTPRVLTMEYIEGEKLSDVIARCPPLEERRRLALLLARAMTRQALRDGVYHADPHPGNLLVTLDGRLVFTDFGLVGFLDEPLRDALIGLVMGIIERDVTGMSLALQDLGVLTRPVPQRALQRDLQRLLQQYYEIPLSQISIGQTLQQMLSLAIKYGVQVPPELGQLSRTLITLEGVVRQLDPDLSLMEIAEPVAVELRRERFSMERISRELRRNAIITARLLDQLPTRLQVLLQRLEEGRLPVIIEQGDLDRNLPQIGRLVNRLAAALVISSTLLTAGVLLGLGAAPTWKEVSLPGLVGLLLGSLGGAWLMWSILRSGRL